MREKLMESLSAEFDITILSTGDIHQKKLAAERSLKVIDIGTCKQNPLGILGYLLRLNKQIRKIRPDLVLTFTIRPAIWGNLITRLYGIPTITTITGTGPLFTRKSLTYGMARILYKFSIRKTARVFFQNEEDRELFIRHRFVNAAATGRIPGSGVDTDHFRPAILGPFWHQNLRKNTVTREEIELWNSKGIINYIGHADDIRPYLSSFDCIVLPSYREGLNNVLLEACSMERPCITTNVTGCREIIEDGNNGHLCEHRDAHSLAEKMEMMFHFSAEKRHEMGKNGRNKVIKEFDKKLVIRAYHEAIRELL